MPAIMLNGKNYSGSGHAHFMETTEPDRNIGMDGDLYTLYFGQEIITVYQKINGEWLPFPSGVSVVSMVTTMSINENVNTPTVIQESDE